MADHNKLTAYIKLVIEEARVREADVSDGSRVPHGSSKHVKDLEIRIADLMRWRDKQKRGSEARANYSRLISRLRAELASARRLANKKGPMKESKWWKDPSLMDPDSPSYIGREAKYARFAEDPEYKGYIDAIQAAADPKELAKAKKTIIAAIDSGQTDLPDGVWAFFFEKRRDELKLMNTTPRSAEDARADRILRTRDSSGKAKSRK